MEQTGPVVARNRDGTSLVLLWLDIRGHPEKSGEDAKPDALFNP